MWPLLQHLPPFPQMVASRVARLSDHISFRPIWLSGSSRKSSSSSYNRSSKTSATVVANPSKEYAPAWPQPTNHGTGSIHPEANIHNAEREILEDKRRGRIVPKIGWLDRNRSLWVDDRGHLQTLTSTSDAEINPKDEDEGNTWPGRSAYGGRAVDRITDLP